MTISLGAFLAQLSGNPVLTMTVCLTLAVILVNGWTDAPNAIATAVSTGAMEFHQAVLLAAVCNFMGVVCMTAMSTAVAETIYQIADFGPDSEAALAALCAAMTAIVAWAVLAWRFGVPTSESHALVAGVTGAALALQGGASNLRAGPWLRVLLGLFLSVALGMWLGKGAARLLRHVKGSNRFFRGAQIWGAGAMAFLHGAQDGQKFMGVFLLGVALAGGRWDVVPFSAPLWLMALCAAFMALGTLMGGRRIIDNVGKNLTPLTPRQGLAADLGGAVTLLLCTLLGLPVSTTHAKTAAILGVGAEAERINYGAAHTLMLTWVLTFPGCGLIGFLTARLFLRLF